MIEFLFVMIFISSIVFFIVGLYIGLTNNNEIKDEMDLIKNNFLIKMISGWLREEKIRLIRDMQNNKADISQSVDTIINEIEQKFIKKSIK